MRISVFDKIGDRATDMEQGNVICHEIAVAFSEHEIVEVDFSGLNTVLPTFLNNAIGSLYREYSSDFLNEHLRITNLCGDDIYLLKMVLSRAKEFYSVRESHVQ